MPFGWRPDGDLAADVPATRRIMPYIMRTRNESAVYFEQRLEVGPALAWLEAFRARTGLRATILHLLIHGVARTLKERPRLNRFTVGGRIYQRRGIWVSFSAKKVLSDDLPVGEEETPSPTPPSRRPAPIAVVKREIDPAWSFEDLVRRIEEGIGDARSDRRSATDKELSIVLRLPGFLLGWLVRAQLLLDRLGLLPGAFYRNDPLYASVFIANLGSVGLDAAFHHLYEYGNIPIFIVAGKIEDGHMTVRYTFDERVEDGLYCARALEVLKRAVERPGEAEPA